MWTSNDFGETFTELDTPGRTLGESTSRGHVACWLPTGPETWPRSVLAAISLMPQDMAFLVALTCKPLATVAAGTAADPAACLQDSGSTFCRIPTSLTGCWLVCEGTSA